MSLLRRLRGKWPFLVFFLVVVAIILILKNSHPAQKHQDKDHRPSLIADVGTNKQTSAQATNATTNKWPEKAPHPDGRWRHGEGPRSVAVTNGYVVTYPNDPSVQMILPRPQDAPPFYDYSDNEIASILSIKPGETAILVPLPPDFDQKFVNSLTTKIEILPDDPPEKAELKRQVLQAREVLKEAVKNGESPREILLAERKNLHRLMSMRDNYQSIVNEQVASGASAEDVQDTINAANMMLEKEGITNPVRLPYRERVRLRKMKKH